MDTREYNGSGKQAPAKVLTVQSAQSVRLRTGRMQHMVGYTEDPGTKKARNAAGDCGLFLHTLSG
tara:strand:+ start:1681 stop:1875 length:195 start_codon:yes stop_codon:yes gene_type:complete